MRKFVLIAAIALTAGLVLGGCSKGQEQDQQAAQKTQAATKPTSITDAKGWNAYLGQLVQKNLQGMAAQQPYAYLVTPGQTDDDKAQNDRQLQNVQDAVARGVLPGNLMAFAGPVSATTADLVVAAFKDAKPGTFKGVIVVFIGDQADQQRVADVVNPSGATFRFVQM
ncbi:MAG: hypothetical protein BGP10_13395 [Rhodanobacter sp. 68-29]|uniref:hypothetical protein n=1 Tax=Rhodanobacter sp. PCA2 TaxID=2006117 RepID=UPI00086C3242|nr:hypothetical protein [Rhodanobacter sp. PCA2]MBA2077314.1 hypothetical protein [Rhodanobacter sp. PCA2]MBN8924604.1 hypothetical protein [Rhodanobacter sp.]ODU92237.1 MAG: hypothetical protein ABT18_13245 [Rhodanobacter sp. SCN 66-43]OJY58318.1 MAG: hypothetical protein BGP10_13395 [Rhodanobacter sp. 68-29]